MDFPAQPGGILSVESVLNDNFTQGGEGALSNIYRDGGHGGPGGYGGLSGSGGFYYSSNVITKMNKVMAGRAAGTSPDCYKKFVDFESKALFKDSLVD